MPEYRMYGLWDSPITPRSLAESLRLSEPCWDSDGRTLGWIEGRSDRGVLVVQRAGDAPRDLTADISVRALVGYGGGDFTLSNGVAYFVGQADQRIYRQELAGGPARPITPPFGACSTPAVSPDGHWVAYLHSFEDEDCIAVVDTRGESWPVKLGRGRDFYSQPAWSPDSARLVWTEWDHPNMPWDGTEIRVTELVSSGGLPPRIAGSRIVAGGTEVACTHPVFGPDGDVYFVSDESGWGQIYRVSAEGGKPLLLTDGSGEYGHPAWRSVERLLVPLPDGGVVGIRQENGFSCLVRVEGGQVRPITGMEPYDSIVDLAGSAVGGEIAAVCSAPTIPPRMVSLSLEAEGGARIRRYSATEAIPASALATPVPVSWRSFDGEMAHGLYYPPASDRFHCDGPPPLVVVVHGGPTSQATAGWNPQVQFLATRGFAVFLVNYRGSTGYGRKYMLSLRGNWGIYDVEDSLSGARHLVDTGRADASRLVIMGGSAGGFTVLQSLIEHPGFYRAGVCLYGVSNMFSLARETHKFEARYLDSLLGPLPQAAAVYRERSPLFRADAIVDPVAIFQGDVDRVVPRGQSDAIVASLRGRGVPHEYHVYEGEGHGWRRSDTIETFYRTLEAFLQQMVVLT